MISWFGLDIFNPKCNPPNPNRPRKFGGFSSRNFPQQMFPQQMFWIYLNLTWPSSPDLHSFLDYSTHFANQCKQLSGATRCMDEPESCSSFKLLQYQPANPNVPLTFPLQSPSWIRGKQSLGGGGVFEWCDNATTLMVPGQRLKFQLLAGHGPSNGWDFCLQRRVEDDLNCLVFHPYFGKWPNLASIFFNGVETTN